ncbi:MAG: hypothetical protein C0167_00025 [Nitrososphaera sp.]|nr:MAG: hypothetical protein C0167_00025 [Nitrososphaera sp.]
MERSHADVILRAKMLVLQAWRGFPNERLEIRRRDRLKLQLPGYSEKVLYVRTISSSGRGWHLAVPTGRSGRS